MKKKLAILWSHPIQYLAPLWRALASRSDLELIVIYFDDFGVSGQVDPDFGLPVSWDTPILDGYDSEFVKTGGGHDRPLTMRLPNAAAFLQSRSIDAILIGGYTRPFEIQAIRAAKRLGIKVLMRGEFSDFKPGRSVVTSVLRDAYLRRIYRKVDAFFAIGTVARHHLERLGVSPEKIFFSPYAVDSDFFEDQSRSLDRRSIRQDLGIAQDEFAFLFTGKMIERKRVLLLLDAITEIPGAERPSLILVGDGPLMEQVSDRGKDLLGARLHLGGFVNQSELAKFYVAADAFVLPSQYEAWGLVVNEAMQFALPAIVSDKVSCHPDLIREGETGYVFRHGCAEDLARKMALLSENPDRCRAMGRNARELIRDYSPARSADGVVKGLESLFSSSAPTLALKECPS